MSRPVESFCGKRIAYIGNSSQHLTGEALVTRAREARNRGYDSIALKRFDGPNRWYKNVDQLHTEKQAVNGVGCGLILWGYCYGPRYNIIQQEVNLLKEMMQVGDFVIGDLEIEWNSNLHSIQTFIADLSDKASRLIVTTWADPSLQAWMPNIAYLGCYIAAFQPQAYSSFLYKQMNIDYHNCQPALMPGVTMGDIETTIKAENQYHSVFDWSLES